MATTEKGIYYPDDYNKIADVPADMKKMAESIDSSIETNKYDDSEINESLKSLGNEQNKQSENIEKNAKTISKNAENIEKNTELIQALKEENANLKAQIPTGTAAGEEISLSDSTEMELVDFGLQGNSKQDGEPTLENPVEVEAVGDSGSVEIVKSNKNLLKLNNYSKTLNAINIDITKGNHIKIVGTATNNTTFYLLGNNQNMEILNRINKISNGKNIILQKTPTESPHFEIIATTDTNNYYLQINEKKSAASKMKNEEIKILKLFIPPNINFNYEFDLQFEITNQATDIVQPKENTYNLAIQKPFYKIGDYADKFIKQDGKWYAQHYIFERILNGRESWKLSSNSYRTFYFDLYNFSNGIATTLALSNYFKNQHIFNADVQAFDLANLNQSKTYVAARFCVSNSSEITSIEEWKSKLQTLNEDGNPLKLYYILETPELIECTEEQIQVLEQIIADGTYKGVTHYYTTQDLKPTIELTYYKDLETLFKNQASIQATLNNVQAQILEIGG